MTVDTRQFKYLKVFIIFLCLLMPKLILAQDTEVYTHQLSQSTSSYTFWTTPPADRVFKDSEIPSEVGSEIKVYAAKNEFEPFQVVVQPASSGSITIHMGDFGSGITTELFQVDYVNIATATDNLGQTGPYPDPLWPIEDGATISVQASENTAFWISIQVPAGVAAGDYTTNVQIAGVDIPVRLHVFDFAIPDQLHVKSQMNFSHNTVLTRYSVPGTDAEYWMYVDMMKQFFIDHRLTPKSVNWPGGVANNGAGPFIDYDCADTLTDNDGIWGFEELAHRYLDGTGLLQKSPTESVFTAPFNQGTGFPSFMAATFLNNDASQDQRRTSMCSLTRTSDDWYVANNPSSAYNQMWLRWMTALRDYLNNLGYLDKAYYYFANEPQDQADYDAVAWYSQLLKSAVPDLKLMVSEQPRPEIYNHPTYTGAKIDIWLPVLQKYDPNISHDREVNYGEETWVYFLHGTRPPYFNPITLDHPGIESKFTGWFLWKYRIRGIAYYSMNDWSKNPWTDPMTDGHNGDTFMLYPPSKDNINIAYGSNNHRLVPSIRIELMRDSLEDYEYLYVLNGGAQPAVGVANDADTQADKIISGLTSYTRDVHFMYNLRRLIGMKNGNEIATIPDIQPPALHPRAQGAPGNYYINFQDPAGAPLDDPLIVDGKEYMKIGWNDYDQDLGYGWYGDMAHVEYRYLSDGPNELQKSIVFDDWGREKVFEFDLPNGIYNVTVSVGWYDQWNEKRYSHHKITIEGVSFVNDEETWNPDNPYIVRTKEITISDNKLTMEMGIFNEYTMLNYLDIEASGPDTTPPVITLIGANPLQWLVGTSPYVDPGATASDNVDGNLTGSITTDTSAVNVNTIGTYTVTYSVTDTAGNTATATRTVQVTNTPPDVIPPVITLIGDNPLTWPQGTAYNDPGATATDNVDGDLSQSITITATAVNVNVPGTYTVNFAVTDSAGNTGTATRTVVVTAPPQDTTPPVITVVGTNPVSIPMGMVYQDAGATAMDDTDGNISNRVQTDTSGVNVNTPGTYTVTYTVTDNAGNTATATRVVYVIFVEDQMPPAITVLGANPMTIDQGTAYNDPGARAVDNVDGDISNRIQTNNGGLNVNVPGTYTITYSVRDSAGNSATATRTVHVVSTADTTAPVITVLGTNPVTLNVGSGYHDAGATAQDNVDGDLTQQIQTDLSQVNVNAVGTYTVRYSVTDSAGNTATATRTVQVVNPSADTLPPIITINGNNPLTITLGTSYQDPGASAQDNVDGDVTSRIQTDTSQVNIHVAGVYTVIYTVSDNAGNTATATRTVQVVNPSADTLPPIITINGNNPLTITLGTSYQDPGASAQDDVDGDVTSRIQTDTSQVNIHVAGVYTVIYTVSDNAGNTATATRTVQVVTPEDSTAPVIFLKGSNPAVVITGAAYTDAGATARDDMDGDLTAAIQTDMGGLDIQTPGIYTITYTVSDTAGNSATATRQVWVTTPAKGNLTVTVTGIPSDLIPDPTADVQVEILDPVTRQVLAAQPVNANGVAEFASLLQQSYCIRIRATDADDPMTYVPHWQQDERFLLTSSDQSVSIALAGLVPIQNAAILNLHIAGDYVKGDPVVCQLIDTETGTVALSRQVATDQIVEYLPPGKYRLLITGQGYTPYEYGAETGSRIIALNTSRTIYAYLESMPEFNPVQPDADMAYTMEPTGFRLHVILHGFQSMHLTIMGDDEEYPINEDAYTGTGTPLDPYVYHWTPADPFTSRFVDYPEPGDTTYTVTFSVYDSANAADSVRTFSCVYVDYASSESEELGKTADQKELENRYNGTTMDVTRTEREFYPLLGTTIQVILRSPEGVDRLVNLQIPPIPLDYLFIDDATNTDGGNLDYNRETDYYHIDVNKDGFKQLSPTDRIKVKLAYFTFSGDAVANGVSIGFEVSGGPHHGLQVRYNPIWKAGGTGRDPHAPAITMTLMLNPDSPAFKNLNRLSESANRLKVLVSEKGDGIFGFKEENLNITVQDDGLLLVDVHHLTSMGLELADTGTQPDDTDDAGQDTTSDGHVTSNTGDSNSGCFIATLGPDKEKSDTPDGAFRSLLVVLGLLVVGMGRRSMHR